MARPSSPWSLACEATRTQPSAAPPAQSSGGLAAGGKVTVALAQFGRVLSALGESRHEDAFACARRLFDPADPAHHPVVAGWLIGDLAEAALHVDRVDEGRRLLAQVEAIAGPRPAVWIELNLRHARALLASDEAEAQRCFDDALAADLGRWPFQRARLLLAYGEWLRRQRRIAESRTPLRTAREIFDTLGCMSWSERARPVAQHATEAPLGGKGRHAGLPRGRKVVT